MCDPISIAGVALSGAGMAANSIAANQVQHATNAVEQQTSLLNNVQLQRAENADRAATNQFQGFTNGVAASGAKLGDLLAAKGSAPSSLPSWMAPTNAQTQTATAQAGAPLASFRDQQAHALGNMRSFGDYLQNANIGAQHRMNIANQASDFMRGNSAVEGLQLNDASHAGDTTSMIGSALSGLGGLGVRAGLTGFGTSTTPGVSSGYGSTIGSLFGGDPTLAQVRQAGLNAGLTANAYGEVF